VYEFFISYSRHDANYARAFGETFALLGVGVWLAEAEILVEGRKRLEDQTVLRDILAEAAASARRCLVLMSPDALESDWVLPVEVAHFLSREQGPKQTIWPVLIGPEADAVRERWPEELAGIDGPECRDLTAVAQVSRDLCRAAGVMMAADDAPVPPASARTFPIRLTVTTERRSFAFVLDIGSEWMTRPLTGQGMLLNLSNADTGLTLNLIVGAMPSDFARGQGAGHVEQANYFAEPFVTRRIAFLSEFRSALTARGMPPGARCGLLSQLLKLKLITTATGRPEILGSHVVNVQGQPHFAYTYRIESQGGRPVIARKYSIILSPPGSDRYFEFVFTAGFLGDYLEFIRRIGRAGVIVRSFRFVK
jgi:hypothetical protein